MVFEVFLKYHFLFSCNAVTILKPVGQMCLYTVCDLKYLCSYIYQWNLFERFLSGFMSFHTTRKGQPKENLSKGYPSIYDFYSYVRQHKLWLL